MFSILKKCLKICLPSEQYTRLQKWYWKARKKHPIRKWKNAILKYFRLAIFYPLVYKWYSRTPIDDQKVLLVEPSKAFSNNYFLLHKELTTYYDFDIHIHLLKKFFSSGKEYQRRCLSLIRDMATSRYIFFDEGCNDFGRICFRNETQVVQIWHACGAFKKFGFSTSELLFGGSRKELERYPVYKYFTKVSVSSPNIIWAYSEAMGLECQKILPLGVSRTDVFFDNDYVQLAKKKLDLYMPASKGKKIILFAPTFRGRVARATTATAFSIAQFYEALADEYVLIIKHHPYVKKPPAIAEKYRNFAVDFTNVMDIEELLCVADICISDYSSLIFEYSLFEKPMIFFAYDVDEYFDWRGFYYNYDELTPGPVFKTNREMIDYIQHIDERFDRQKVIDFRNKFMSACDGHSTERILKDVFGDELQKHHCPEKEMQKIPETIEPEPWGEPELTIEEIKAKLYEKYPQLEGKKLIAYFMRSRPRKGYPLSQRYIDWQRLYEFLDEQYAVLYIRKGKIPVANLPEKHQRGRFVSCQGLLTGAELSKIADFSITDFVYDAAAYQGGNWPTLVFAPDYRWYCSSVEDYRDSTDLLREKGYFFETTDDVIKAVGTGNSLSLDRKQYIEEYQKLYDHFSH